MTYYEKFKLLHRQQTPLLIGNAWNVQSANVYQKLDFQAIGTSSAAVANSLGYNDGQEIPFAELLYIVERIQKNIDRPLTVDIESGFSQQAEQVAQNISDLYQLGVAGINIEDSNIEGGVRVLRDATAFSTFLKEVIQLLTKEKISMFVNVRCDAFLLNHPDALQQAKQRITQYEHAGADGIFLPYITRVSDIEQIVSHTTLPLNVMCMPDLPDFETLNTIGVKRISMGDFLNGATYNSLEKTTTRILNENSFRSLFTA